MLYFHEYKKIKIPEGLNFWLFRTEDEVSLETDALEQPRIILYPTMRIGEGRWIFKDSLREYMERTLEPLIDNHVSESLTLLFSTPRFKVFRDKKNVYFYSSEKIRTFPNPKYLNYNIYGVVVGYNEKSILITPSTFIEYNGVDNILYEEEETLYVSTREGQILKINNYGTEYIGYCQNNEKSIIGKSSLGVFLNCGGQVKQFMRGTWRLVGRTMRPEASVAGDNYLLLTNYNTEIYNPSLLKIAELRRVHSASLVDDRIVIASRSGEAAVVSVEDFGGECVDRSEVEGFLLKLYVNRVLCPGEIDVRGEVNFSEVLKQSDREAVVLIHPRNTEVSLIHLHFRNPFIDLDYRKEFSIGKLDIQVVKSDISWTPTGNVIGSESNAILDLELTAKLGGHQLPATVELKVNTSKFQENMKRIDGCTFSLSKTFRMYSREDIGDLQLEVMDRGYILHTLGINPRVLEIRPDFKVPPRIDREVLDGVIREKTVYENQNFQWIRLAEKPADPYPIIIAREGDRIRLGEEEVKVSRGMATVGKQFIYGVPCPVEEIRFFNRGEFIEILFDEQIKTLKEVIYGTRVLRSEEGRIMIPIDPSYGKLKVTVYYATLKWVFQYYIDSLILSLRVANQMSRMLYGQLKTFIEV